MKAILVIDVDEKYIDSFGKEIQFINEKYNCNWELKPMPNRWIPQLNGLSIEQQIRNIDFAAGWNTCLEKIRGEE